VERRSGLGRGLGALIPGDAGEATRWSGAGSLVDLPVDQVEPNPNQPRRHFDEESLVALAESVRELGVLQPVLVRQVGERYQLIAGERRWRAARRAGLATIPAIIRSVEDVQSVEQALVENLHRQDLGPLEEAAAYQQLIDDFGLTHEDVATRVGRSRATVSNMLRLFHLPPSIQRLVSEGRLSAGHARALLGTPDRAYQEALARKAADEDWSVRAVEEAVRARNGGGAPASDDTSTPGADTKAGAGGGANGAGTRLRPPGLLELEELLSSYLDTRVSVKMGGKRGRVVIDFATLEDLERIYRRVTAAG
jgi:ParB family chromosome partitioning protein